MSTEEQRAEYLRRSAAARECLTPPRAKDWEGDALTDVLMAVDLVANTVMDEAKKNPVQQRDAFLWAPAMNSYLFGQSMHDVGRAVMDELIRAGWAPPSRVREHERHNMGIPVDTSWVTTESKSSNDWHWVLAACALILLVPGAVVTFGIWAVTR